MLRKDWKQAQQQKPNIIKMWKRAGHIKSMRTILQVVDSNSSLLCACISLGFPFRDGDYSWFVWSSAQSVQVITDHKLEFITFHSETHTMGQHMENVFSSNQFSKAVLLLGLYSILIYNIATTEHYLFIYYNKNNLVVIKKG